jgi:uncharacterized CHY-type Zn-finger protein
MIPIHTRDGETPNSRKQVVAEPPHSRVVPKPVPASQAQDPRQYHIDQVKRRFSPKESTAPDGSTSLLFKLTPSDPDFPFELTHLECDLRVPQNYPKQRPQLLVKNNDIPRGFGINVERGWDRLADEKKEVTLLTLINALDRNLEKFLSEQKVDTIKLVAFQGVKDTRHMDAAPSEPTPAKPVTPLKPSRPYKPDESFTRDQIKEAQARRAQEVRQLEARMGRTYAFRRSADSVVFTLPLEPKRRDELPPGLQSVNTIHLIVPLLYPLQDVRIQLNEADADDATPVEDMFTQKAAAQKQMTLMSLMNYLAQNLHSMAKQVAAEASKAEVSQVPVAEETSTEAAVESQPAPVDEGKSHIQVIARPPEWSLVRDDQGSDSDELYSDDTDEGGADLSQQDEKREAVEEGNPERGTMMSFPSVELHGIELLQVSVLSITAKCERCKLVNEFTGLKPGVEKTMVCKKCNSPLAAKFRPQLVHEFSTRAGFIDFSGCKVADMLPSTFVPTCGKCSTPGLGLVSVRGESVSNVCRECHSKFTFKIPEVKFLFITPGTLPPPAMGPRRKQEKLGLHAGEPLPGKGACSHYRKSYRWFRFSCCNKVHSCDKCHDDAEDHINEWANRMICGWCSREQNYAVEACGFCGRSVIGRKGRGFWEGGKGTRDQKLMSRKDPRKYKRIGTVPANK